MSSSLLEARELRFRYDPEVPLVEHFSAAFAAGEMVAITGPSGRGKSTLLHLLGLMLKPTGGSVALRGTAVQGLSDRSRAGLRAVEFGFVFQDAALDATRTVLQNILETTLYRGERNADIRPRAAALMEQFGVGLRANAKPGQVSGGQAQRIALCRALIGNPTVILADEPTGNLDPSTSPVVMEALRSRASQGCAVIIVTHDPGVVTQCDRQVEL